jgi:transaldolase
MAELNYLEWLANETKTVWWHDSGDPKEVPLGRQRGASGVTTNPVLAFAALSSNQGYWKDKLAGIESCLPAKERAEKLMSLVVRNAASMFETIHRQSGRKWGYVCAQVNPALCADKEAMLAMAGRFSSWAPNISVKLPATAAGMETLEECTARGICVTSTVSFAVSQVVAAAERYERGRLRAEKAGIKPAPCFAVIMIGRVDDYLREVFLDNHAGIEEADIKVAGLAIVKRAYEIFRQKGYKAQLLIAALRGAHHMEGLCGGEVVMSIHPSIQKVLLAPDVSRRMGIAEPVPKEALRRLHVVPEFRKAYETDGMWEKDFITFGLTQKTLSQFSAGGWSLLETMQFPVYSAP